ncbi:MAG: AI-2E family transporter [Bacteroidetes bacterium]|nr:AI-2E family transporter [Bacteroidota bacterium]
MNINDNRRYITLLIIIVLGIFLAWSLSGFLTALLSAIILYVLMKPLMRYLLVKRRWNKTPATVVAMIITFLTILGPVWTLYGLLASKINYALSNSTELIEGLRTMDLYIFETTGIKILSEEMVNKLQELAGDIIPQILGATADMLATFGMMYFILYYLLTNLGQSEKALGELLPVEEEKAIRFAAELESAVFSNVLGAPVLAILQGLTAGFAYWIFGLDEPWFWGAITGFMSFIPLIGTAIVWIPAGIYQLVNGENWQGIGILIFGAVVITNIDNVFRFTLQKKFADIHPIVTVLGVIVGLKWFGITGIVFGPLLISYFLLMIKMYKEEYH